MKRRICLLLAVCVFGTLYACGCDDGREVDLVFVNGSGTTISSVQVASECGEETARHAGGCPLKRGESYGFEAGDYPVTVAAYEGPSGREELAQVTVSECPPDGERWYVTARDGTDGLRLTVDTCWPDGVEKED